MVCKNIKAVWGNMDRYEVRKALPEKEIIKIANFKIGVMHGYGAPNSLIELMIKVFQNEEVNLIIFGHSHCAVKEKIKDTLYFNPGSPTDKFFSPYNSYGMIEIDEELKAEIIKI
jgi:hypothetical protein